MIGNEEKCFSASVHQFEHYECYMLCFLIQQKQNETKQVSRFCWTCLKIVVYSISIPLKTKIPLRTDSVWTCKWFILHQSLVCLLCLASYNWAVKHVCMTTYFIQASFTILRLLFPCHFLGRGKSCRQWKWLWLLFEEGVAQCWAEGVLCVCITSYWNDKEGTWCM